MPTDRSKDPCSFHYCTASYYSHYCHHPAGNDRRCCLSACLHSSKFRHPVAAAAAVTDGDDAAPTAAGDCCYNAAAAVAGNADNVAQLLHPCCGRTTCLRGPAERHRRPCRHPLAAGSVIVIAAAAGSAAAVAAGSIPDRWPPTTDCRLLPRPELHRPYAHCWHRHPVSTG